MEASSNKLNHIRSQFPVLTNQTYLNTGTCGPLPVAVADSMTVFLNEQLNLGRIKIAYYDHVSKLKTEARTNISSVIGSLDTEIALTSCTSEGLNIVINGIDWQENDEVITSNIEHVSGYTPLFQVQKKHKIKINYIDILNSLNSCLDQISNSISPRTKLISLSHVSYCTGDVLPVKEICSLAKEKGIPVLIDGAQSFLSIPVDIKELGCDFYAAPGQKWLCGPEETGFLYVSAARLNDIHAAYTGYGSFQSFSVQNGLVLENNSRRFEFGTSQPMNLAGFNKAFELLRSFDIQWCFEHISALNKQLYNLLTAIDQVSIVNNNLGSGLLAFKIKGQSSEQIVEKLSAKNFIVRTVPITDAIRVSTGFYNSPGELQSFSDELTKIIRS